jgi:hypothetical protein
LRALTGICLITILLGGPTELWAQGSAPPDPIESMPFRFGAMGLSPTLSITNLGIDSNVFNDAVDPQSDFTMTVTPRIQARLRSGRTLLSGSLATGLIYYKEFSEERSIDYTADVRGDVDLGRFRPYASAARLDTQERLNAELDIRAPRVQTDLIAGASFYATARMGIVGSIRQSSLTFDEASVFEGVPLSRTLNSDTTIVEGGLEFYVTPLTTVSVVASRQEDRFDQSPERDADSIRVMPSIRLEAPAIVEGSFAAGYRSFDGLDPTLPDYSGLVFKGTLSHTFLDRTRVEVLLSRDVQYSFEELEPYYLMSGLRVTVSHLLRDAIDLRASAGRERLDYRAERPVSDSRRDTADIISIGGGYRLQPNLRLGLDLEFAWRDSDRPERAYDRTRLLGSLSYGF